MRFTVPCLLTALTALLVTHESSLPFVLERYSFVFAGALLACVGVALTSWVIALRERRVGTVLALHATVFASIGFSAYAAEAVFRFALLENKVPTDEAEFTEIIARAWPEPRALERRPGRLRILGISDSFGLAAGPDNYHYELEHALRAQGLDVEIVNLSITGIAAPEQLELLDRYGARYAPDLILHGIFAGNDLNLLPGRLRHFRHIGVREHRGLAAFHPRHFTLVQALDGMARLRADRRRKQAEPGAAEGVFSREHFVRHHGAQLVTYARAVDSAPLFARARGSLRRLRARAAQLGIPYAALILPERMQVEHALRDEVLTRYALDPAGYDWERTQRFLRERLAVAGVPYLDLLPAFRAHAAAGGHYLPHDTHLNAAGNRLVAEQATPFVQALLGDLPARPRLPAVASGPARLSR